MCREAKILLVVSALFTFASGLSGIFVDVFFWRETNNIIVIVIYNLIHFIVTPITFIAAGVIAKKKNGIWSLRIGLLTYALFYALILFIGGRGIPYIYLLGGVFGMATGFYWLAFNTLCFDFTSVNNRDTFNGFRGSCTGIAAAISPIISAYIISRFTGFQGYRIVFTITLFIFLSLVLVSVILRCESYGSKINFKKVFSSNGDGWKVIRKATFALGFRDIIIGFLINILIVQTTGSEFSLGKLTLIASLLSSVSYILVQKVIKPPQRKLSINIGSIGAFLAVAGLMLNIEYKTLLIYIIMDAFFLPFFMIQMSSSTFNVIDEAHQENMRIEYLINKDIMLNGGRAISAVILIVLLSTFKNSSILKVYLIILGLAPVVSGYFLRKLTKVLEGKGL